jgi:hypothetical protein
MSASFWRSLSGPRASRLWLAAIASWLILQNTVLLGVAATHVEWVAVRQVVSGLWKVAEVLVEVVLPRLSLPSLAVVAGTLSLGAAVTIDREGRHA